MVFYDDHAEFQLKRRRIVKEWVEETLANPDETETKGSRRSFCAACPIENSCYGS